MAREAWQVQCGEMLSSRPSSLPYDGYLLTGGLGGVGRVIVSHMAQVGTRRVVLVSRAVARLCNDSLAIEAHACQCAEPMLAVSAARGMLHAAGMLRDGIISSLSFASFAAVLAPKVRASVSLTSNTVATRECAMHR